MKPQPGIWQHNFFTGAEELMTIVQGRSGHSERREVPLPKAKELGGSRRAGRAAAGKKGYF